MYQNSMKLEFLSKSQNESFARVSVSSFIAELDPTIDVIADIKTAVSEAVTNAIIHGYEGDEDKIVKLECKIEDRDIEIRIEDDGKGIDNVEQAMQPLYTSRPDLERSGMGFTVMESFMDEITVECSNGAGTVVTLKKHIK